MALIDLPNELLARIYHYLDWNPAEKLSPDRVDIFNISLTCRKLRESVFPVLFKTVRLRLRWANDGLIEPTLYNLRRDYPHLARHIRCAEVDTRFADLSKSFTPSGDLDQFLIPTTIDDWIDLGSRRAAGFHEADVYAKTRMRVNAVARHVYRSYEDESPSPLRDNASAEEIIHRVVTLQNDRDQRRGLQLAERADLTDPNQRLNTSSERQPEAVNADVVAERNRQKSIKLSLEALAIVMLCLPPTTNTLLLRAISVGDRQNQRKEFALRVAKVAMLVFNDRIRGMTVVMNHRFRGPLSDRRQPTFLPELQDLEADVECGRSVSEKVTLDRLTVATCDEKSFPRDSSIIQQNVLSEWYLPTKTVRHLDLRCGKVTAREDLLGFVKRFESLESLHLDHVVLSGTFAQAAWSYANCQLLWLQAVIEIRRCMRYTDIALGKLYVIEYDRHLPTGCITWIIKEAVPVGCTIDLEREDRLTSDFVSFLPFWRAEHDQRGLHAQVAWEKHGGSLVDQAMSSRWR